MIDYDIPVTRLFGEEQTISQQRGKVMLVVNTASKCGLTPQFGGLEALHRDFSEAGLSVLGFPCDQFAHQEPGSDEEIAEFCQINYGVSFPMHTKIEVNGRNTHPLFQQLKRAAPGAFGSGSIKWNFTKFLVGRDGEVIKRYAPTTPPGELAQDIEAALCVTPS